MAHELGCIRALLLTDVEGSSRLWHRHPAIMGGVFDGLELVEQTMRSLRGEVIKSRGEGDSHFVVFDQASYTARAAALLQQPLATSCGLSGFSLRVRMALHAGEVEPRAGEYVGRSREQRGAPTAL